MNLADNPHVPIQVHPKQPMKVCVKRDDADSRLLNDQEQQAAVLELERALEMEPGTETILSHMEPFLSHKESPIREVVFCGCGEPLIRLEQVLAVSEALKKKNLRIRINTNGHAGLIHGKSVPDALKGLVDAVSISLNAHDAATYVKLCRPAAGARAFETLLDFSKRCVEVMDDVTMSVVSFTHEEADLCGVRQDIQACQRIADKIGSAFRVR